MKLAILLTATIQVQVVQGNFSTTERLEMYASTLRYYSKTIGRNYPIVFLENSGYGLSELKKEFDKKLDIEFVQFKPNGELPFNSSKGKGYNEYLMIGGGVLKSEIMKTCTHFLKITGRYPMLNVLSMIKEIEKRSVAYSFMCDIKETGLFDLIGYNNDGHWGDSRFWASEIEFYKKELIECYKWMDDRQSGRFAEDYLYQLSVGNRNNPHYSFRFKHQVRFGGISGAVSNVSDARGNYDYNSFVNQIKFYVRSVLRLIMPNIWF